MPAIIDSAPDCIISEPGTEEARVEDSADFVIGDPYADCAGLHDLRPRLDLRRGGRAAPRPSTWS